MSASGVLVDTGPLVAIIDHDDQWHSHCVSVLRELRLPLLTSLAVVTELFHFVDNERERSTAWALLQSRNLTIGAIDDTDLPAIAQLMAKYADTPMDFADATLVYLARREEISTILTLDSDFDVYRIEGKKKFRVLPGRR